MNGFQNASPQAFYYFYGCESSFRDKLVPNPSGSKASLSRLNAENKLHTLVYCIPPNPTLS